MTVVDFAAVAGCGVGAEPGGAYRDPPVNGSLYPEDAEGVDTEGAWYRDAPVNGSLYPDVPVGAELGLD